MASSSAPPDRVRAPRDQFGDIRHRQPVIAQKVASRNRTTLLLGTAQFNGPLVAIPAGTIRANVELEGGRYILRS
ncbi:hypothetical protein, partial [Blastomonas sp.]|uniref:hypothetical protein n=1 Tax=Blastomonas sp. TaxID=1909299 RepID=UPI003593343B